MNHIFKKADLPFIEAFANGSRSPRNYWTLARRLQEEDGFTANEGTIALLLQQGAALKDPWAMCELARFYFAREDVWLPTALHWWHKALKQHDVGASWDVENRPIYDRINSYCGAQTEYANIEMRCALLTEWTLTRLGRDDWYALLFEEQKARVERLIWVASAHLHIRPPKVRVQANCTFNGQLVDGLADPTEHALWIRKECFADLNRLIQVIFHELGHFVVFSIWNDGSWSQKARFGITDTRIASWINGDMGLEVPTSEEDPDTLSYGVYTTWLVCFQQ